MADIFTRRITLHTADGREGVRHYTSPSSATPTLWSSDGDGETVSAEIDLLDAHTVTNLSNELDGDEWRTFEENNGPAKVLRWLNCPKFFGGFSDCIDAALTGTDPDGWTDAHEALVKQEEGEAAELEAALRDRFAGQAMAAMCGGTWPDQNERKEIAIRAWAMADEMLRARKAVRHG